MKSEKPERGTQRQSNGKAPHPTNDEIDDRIHLVHKLLCAGRFAEEIKLIVSQKYGISPRTVDRYLRRARDMLLADLDRDPAEHRGESLAFYRKVAADPREKARDRLIARKRVDMLLGLDAPKRREHSGPGGGPIPIAVPGRIIIEVVQHESPSPESVS